MVQQAGEECAKLGCGLRKGRAATPHLVAAGEFGSTET